MTNPTGCRFMGFQAPYGQRVKIRTSRSLPREKARLAEKSLDRCAADIRESQQREPKLTAGRSAAGNGRGPRTSESRPHRTEAANCRHSALEDPQGTPSSSVFRVNSGQITGNHEGSPGVLSQHDERSGHLSRIEDLTARGCEAKGTTPKR